MSKAKRFYKVNETVWVKELKIEGVITAIDVKNLSVDMTTASHGTIHATFMEIDKLRKPLATKSEVNKGKATFGSRQTSAPKREARGLDYAFEQVREFQEVFRHGVADVPTSMGIDLAQKRYGFMLEELDEFLLASDGEDKDGNSLDDIQKLAAQADAMLDLIYFALGTLVQIGVRPQPLFDIVQDANMAKRWADGQPHFHEVTGKVLKPEGWQDPAPFLEAEVMRQKSDAVLSSRKK